MGIGDMISNAGTAIYDAGAGAVNASKAAAGWVADKTVAGAQWTADKTVQGAQWTAEKARRAWVRGSFWVENAAGWATDFFSLNTPNEKFPDVLNYDVLDRASPIPTSGAWCAPGGPSHLAPAERSFVYLDVGRWGGSGKNFDVKRDFGLVCGRTALLCAFKFTPASGGKRSPVATPLPNPLKRPEIDQLNKLLAHLATGAMGAVTVRALETSRTWLPGDNDTAGDKIFVIVGDMHLPVMTDVSATRGARVGRIPGHDTAMVQDYADGGPDVGPVPIGDPHLNGTDGWMADADATKWFSLYDKACIFEEAGADLTEFVRLINTFHLFPLHLLQLGDMVDLWLGFECFFLQCATPVVALNPKSTPSAETFVDTWTDSTLTKTSQSQHVANFLGFNGTKNWLYGNHDNYLGAHKVETLWRMSGNLPREKEFLGNHLFAEHGHRKDSHNRDGETSGQGITQYALTMPLIRKVDPSGRRDPLAAAVEKFLSVENSPFVVYAMGHTHAALLTRVVIRNKT